MPSPANFGSQHAHLRSAGRSAGVEQPRGRLRKIRARFSHCLACDSFPIFGAFDADEVRRAGALVLDGGRVDVVMTNATRTSASSRMNATSFGCNRTLIGTAGRRSSSRRKAIPHTRAVVREQRDTRTRTCTKLEKLPSQTRRAISQLFVAELDAVSSITAIAPAAAGRHETKYREIQIALRTRSAATS